MTPDEHEPDPVAAFFAEARSQVHDEPATDLDWQQIVRESRRASRRRGRLALLSSAAVAVIAIFAVLIWQQHSLIDGVQRGQAIQSGADVVNSGAPAGTPSVSSQQTPTKVPASFRTWSVSNAGSNTIYALGSQDCGADTCPVLLRSNTNGVKWNAVHKFTGTDVSAATGTDVPQIQPARALTETRFARPQIGYVFGGDLWGTRDSGATFTKLSHPGAYVLDVEISNQQAVLLSADDCGQGECKGPIYVTRFDTNTGKIGAADAEMTPPAPIGAGHLIVQNGAAFVQLTSANPSIQLPPMRLDGGKLTALKSPSPCGGSALQAVTPTTDSPKRFTLFALCNPQQKGTDTSYTIVRSDNAGTTWGSVSTGALTLPRLGQVWLAAADANHLVASAGGPRDTTGVPAPNGVGSLQRSDTGGKGFGAVPAPKGTIVPKTGFDWTASAGGSLYYAVSRTTPGFWVSTGFGQPWTLVDPRGSAPTG